ncbi:hypothetical protein AQUCO_00800222v1 [Aquilegia coerulea]|uniref:Uncharacterized protein n=1 Tax=Aquilegia coerulea TaxID=218851 RepID=A0A2G5EHZ7_AQUCA|nr:hypothetical protein AQUCO_00800222v1 [Aquilegia coerulea]
MEMPLFIQWDSKDLFDDEFHSFHNGERDIRIQWEYRESNSCADFLATSALKKVDEGNLLLQPIRVLNWPELSYPLSFCYCLVVLYFISL